MKAISSSSDNSLTTCRKPEEPSPMSSASRDTIPVHKIFPRGAPILLGKANNYDFTLIKKYQKILDNTFQPIYLPSILPLIEST